MPRPMAPRRATLPVAILLLAAVAGVLAGSGLVAGSPGVAPADAAAPTDTAPVLQPAQSDTAGGSPTAKLGPTPAAVAPGTASGAGATTTQDDELVERFEYRLLPDDPDWVEADVSYRLPAEADQLSVFGGDADVRVVDGEGFEEQSGDEWAWDGTTESPSVTVRVRVTTDARARDWAGYGTGDWAIVGRPPQLQLASDVSTIGREVTFAVDGEGTAGTDLVYLGDHETHETETDGERIVLVVPDAVQLPDPPDDVVALVAHASDRLRVGHRPEVYHGFVVPDDTNAGLLGRNFGTDSLYFNGFRLDTADGVWVHEYVHARQDTAALTRETRWLSEGSADYYEPLMVLEQGHVDFEAFRAELRRGRRAHFDDVVVSEPSTWQGPNVRYTHGALVAAAIDREIREQTDGEATFQGVLAAWNRDGGSFTQADFLDAVEAQAGPEAREHARVLTETSTLPETWDRRTHERLFEGVRADPDGSSGESTGDAGESSGAALVTEPAGEIAFGIEGPYREGVPAGLLAVGERVGIELTVTNDGTEAGSVEHTLAVGGSIADRASVTVEPGESRTIELVTTLEQPGQYRISAAGESTTVAVRERAEPRVESVDATVEDGTVTVEALLAAGERGLTVSDYEIAAAGRTLEQGTMVVSAGGTRTVRATLPAGDAETVAVTAGDERRTVDVPAGSGDGAAGDGDGLAGFGALPALLAVLATGGGLAARAR